MFIATIGIVARPEVTYPPAGTLISSECYIPYAGIGVQDFFGNYWVGYYASYYVLADGNGGTVSGGAVNVYGCWLPSGFVYSASGSDIHLPGPYGNPVTVGSYSETTVADGAGGSISSSGDNYYIECDATYASLREVDGATGWWQTTSWRRGCGSEPYYVNTVYDAGYVAEEFCGTKDNQLDALGVSWSVPAFILVTTDGAGGFITEFQINYDPCGWLPAGYALNYNPGGYEDYFVSFTYYNSQGQSNVFVYGDLTVTQYADGTAYNGYYTVYGSTPNYTAGYIFYTEYFDYYYDQYIFDGTAGYYVTRVNNV